MVQGRSYRTQNPLNRIHCYKKSIKYSEILNRYHMPHHMDSRLHQTKRNVEQDMRQCIIFQFRILLVNKKCSHLGCLHTSHNLDYMTGILLLYCFGNILSMGTASRICLLEGTNQRYMQSKCSCFHSKQYNQVGKSCRI
jgi:hypothetical protein